MNLEENWAKKRHWAWIDLAPFYLDYGETIQCNFTVNDVKWTKGNFPGNSDDFFELDLLISGQFEQNSFLTNLTVLYPGDDAAVDPSEMVRFDRQLKSSESNQNQIREEYKLPVLPWIQNH